MKAVVRSPEDLGRSLASARRQQGLTQDDVARLLDVDRSYVAKLERGHSSPLLDLLLNAVVDLGGTLSVEFPERTDG